ncbi:MAG: hypothetical protein M3R02_08360 [Chloroflexota bacterium]|nr:hypothetical protein [Chloroflexota bacterium]
MGATPPAPPTVWQFAQVEAVLQQDPNRVLAEEIAAAIPGGAVAPLVEEDGHLAVGGPLRRSLESQQQPRVGGRVRNRDALGILLHSKGEQAVVETLGLALGLALLDLGGEVVGVVLGEGRQGGEDDSPDGGGEVHLLGDGDEAHPGPLQPL